MRKNIINVSSLLSDITTLSSVDFREVVKKANKNDLVYMDPPYKHLYVKAGRSSQSTLLGSNDETIESLYLSLALVERLSLVKLVIGLTPKHTVILLCVIFAALTCFGLARK